MTKKLVVLSMVLAGVLGASSAQATTSWDFNDGVQGWANFGNGDGPNSYGGFINSVCFGGDMILGTSTNWQVKAGDTVAFDHYEGIGAAHGGPWIIVQIDGDATNYIYDVNQRSTSWASVSANLADFSNGSRTLAVGDVINSLKIDVATHSLDSLNLDNARFVPEPMTLGLLSLGGLLLRRRFR